METGITCYACGAILPSVPSQHSTVLASPRTISPSFSPKSLKSSSLFRESLHIMPRSSLKVSKTKNSSLVTKCEIGDSLEEFLTKATPDKGLIRLMMFMGEALRTIAFKVRTASCGGTACVNSFGDEQLAVDMLADKLLFEVVTSFHDYIWGESFYFVPRRKGESLQESIKCHENFLVLLLRLKPGQKVLDVGRGICGPLKEITQFRKMMIHTFTMYWAWIMLLALCFGFSAVHRSQA